MYIETIKKIGWKWIVKEYFYYGYLIFFCITFLVGAFKDTLPYLFHILVSTIILTLVVILLALRQIVSYHGSGRFDVYKSLINWSNEYVEEGPVIPKRYIPSKVAFGGLGFFMGGILSSEISEYFGIPVASDLDMMIWISSMILGIIYGLTVDMAGKRAMKGLVELKIE